MKRCVWILLLTTKNWGAWHLFIRYCILSTVERYSKGWYLEMMLQAISQLLVSITWDISSSILGTRCCKDRREELGQCSPAVGSQVWPLHPTTGAGERRSSVITFIVCRLWARRGEQWLGIVWSSAMEWSAVVIVLWLLWLLWLETAHCTHHYFVCFQIHQK